MKGNGHQCGLGRTLKASISVDRSTEISVVYGFFYWLKRYGTIMQYLAIYTEKHSYAYATTPAPGAHVLERARARTRTYVCWPCAFDFSVQVINAWNDVNLYP